MEKNKFIVLKEEETLRIDKYLSIKFSNYSRVYLSNLIKDKHVLVNNKEISPSYKIKENDIIEVSFISQEADLDSIKPMDFNLDILYEDDSILIINKPQGLVVHPGGGHKDDTLVNALVFANKQLSNINGIERIGIVHRIDKDTSGVLLICKTNYAHNQIAEQLKDHSMNREYYALVKGVINETKGKIIAPIARDKKNRLKMCIDLTNGKEAITFFEVIKRYSKYTLIKCKLLTGRTHQIRCHMEYINHPVIGDPIYGKDNCHLYNNGQLLHAYKLNFIHPITKKEQSCIAPLPKYFNDILNKLE